MDVRRFDTWTRSVAARGSRRAALRALAGGALAAGLARLGLGETAAVCLPGESCDCKAVGTVCSSDGQCCSRLCHPAPGRKQKKCVCKAVGEKCGTHRHCCSRVCVRSDEGGGVCGCRPIGGKCNANKNCCSGLCKEGECGCTRREPCPAREICYFNHCCVESGPSGPHNTCCYAIKCDPPGQNCVCSRY